MTVDTHGQSPWHFTGQASLDLNAHFTIISTCANPITLSVIDTCLKRIQEFSFTHGHSPWNSALRVIRRDIVWADDQTVKELIFNHDGTPSTRELSFTPPYATGESSTDGYHIDLVKDGNIIWTLTDAYPPRLRVSK
jgi:hypothetical protein